MAAKQIKERHHVPTLCVMAIMTIEMGKDVSYPSVIDNLGYTSRVPKVIFTGMKS